MKGVYVSSSYLATVDSKVSDNLSEKPLDLGEEKAYYKGYKITPYRFRVKMNNNASITIRVPYQNAFRPIEARYAYLCRYDEEIDKWILLQEIERDYRSKHFLVKDEYDNFNQSQSYAIFTNEYWYSMFTQEIANEYPRWTQIRRSNKSVGQQFLNFFGMQIEELDEWLTWILDQKFINTADTHVLDWIYSHQLVDVDQSDQVFVFNQLESGTERVPIAETLNEFFFHKGISNGIIDYDENILYTHERYSNLKALIIRGDEEREVVLKPSPFHVWNAFDEFGLLLNLKRNYLEKNAVFKERILDVFRYPSNASREGLKNGIARELNMISRTKESYWENDFEPFLIHNKSGVPIDLNSLKVDYEKIDEDAYQVIDKQHILIKPLRLGRPHTVSFIQGILTYELHNKKDEELYQMTFKDNGRATGRLMKWASYINSVAPIMWDHFRWDEAYWDTVSKELSGTGFIPNMWDASLDRWKEYTLHVNRWEGEKVWQ